VQAGLDVEELARVAEQRPGRPWSRRVSSSNCQRSCRTVRRDAASCLLESPLRPNDCDPLNGVINTRWIGTVAKRPRDASHDPSNQPIAAPPIDVIYNRWPATLARVAEQRPGVRTASCRRGAGWCRARSGKAKAPSCPATRLRTRPKAPRFGGCPPSRSFLSLIHVPTCNNSLIRSIDAVTTRSDDPPAVSRSRSCSSKGLASATRPT